MHSPLWPVIALAIAACSAGDSDGVSQRSERAANDRSIQMTTPETVANDAPKPLPYARGQSFATLDAYLKHLEQGAGIGLPHYREVKPGVYAYITTKRTLADKDGKGMRLFKRNDLLTRYGFAE